MNYRIAANVPPDINGNSPVPVSLVVVTNIEFMKIVEKLSAKDWFEKRDQFHRDDPAGDKFMEWYWEFVPGNSPYIQQIQAKSENVGMVVFAKYHASGDHRNRVTSLRMIQLVMGDDDFTVEPMKAGENP